MLRSLLIVLLLPGVSTAKTLPADTPAVAFAPAADFCPDEVVAAKQTICHHMGLVMEVATKVIAIGQEIVDIHADADPVPASWYHLRADWQVNAALVWINFSAATNGAVAYTNQRWVIACKSRHSDQSRCLAATQDRHALEVATSARLVVMQQLTALQNQLTALSI